VPDLYPAGAPTINGQVISIETWLQQPARVIRTLTDLTSQRFIADRIFSPGPTASGGAVIYDQLTAQDLYPKSRDVQAVEPGAEFPIVDAGDLAPLVARTVKWGAKAGITYEERDRDRRDQVQRKLIKIRNAIVRKVDTVAIATLYAAPINTSAASALWTTTTTDIFSDVVTAQVIVNKLDMGYNLDTALISPKTLGSMLKNTNLRSSLPRENQGSPNPVLVGKLAGVAGITNWYVTNRMPDTDTLLLSGQQAGSISDERPLYSRVIDDPEREIVWVQAGRLTVPFVTDPLSVVRITGVG
jgi:hypothetical protein